MPLKHFHGIQIVSGQATDGSFKTILRRADCTYRMSSNPMRDAETISALLRLPQPISSLLGSSLLHLSSSHLLSSLLTSFHLLSSLLMSPQLFSALHSSQLFSSLLTSSQLFSWFLISSHPTSAHLSNPQLIISALLMSSHLFASHLSSLQLISALLASS